MKRHPACIAFDKWIAENVSVVTGKAEGVYLHNRIRVAFDAGWDLARQAAKDAMTEPVEVKE